MTNNEPTPTITPELAVAAIEAHLAALPDHTRDLAETMIRTGQVNDKTTIADAKVLLQQHYAPQQ